MYQFVKRLGDLALALVLLIVFAPHTIILCILILLEDGRPIFYKQSRAGFKGNPIIIYKLRSLKNDNDPHHPEAYTLRVGRLMRRLGLDEIPQIWNILKGEMSFVGPRPILHPEADNYDESQRRRLDVLPGITGWAQTNGRNNLTWEERITRDLWYVDHASLWLDLRILLRTPAAVLSSDGVYGPGNLDPAEDDFESSTTVTPETAE